MTDKNFPQKFPDWDYYPLWHLLIHYKAKIDKILKLVETIECRSMKNDHQIRHQLLSIAVSIDSLIRGLATSEDDYQ